MALYLALYAPADKPAGPETSGTVNVKKITEMFQAFADNYIGWLEQQTFLNEQSKIRELTNEEKKKLQDLNENIKRKEAAEKAAKEAAEKAAKEAAAKEAARKALKDKAAKEAAVKAEKEAAARKAAKKAAEKAEEAKKAAEKAAKEAAEKAEKEAAKKAKKPKEDDKKELEDSRIMDYSLKKLTTLITTQLETGAAGFENMKKVYTEFKDDIVNNHSELGAKPELTNEFWDKIIEFKNREDVRTWLAIENPGKPTILRSDANQDDIYRKYKGAEENKGYLYSDTDDYQKTVDFRTAFYVNNTEKLRRETFADPRSWLHILLLRAHAEDTKSK